MIPSLATSTTRTSVTVASTSLPQPQVITTLASTSTGLGSYNSTVTNTLPFLQHTTLLPTQRDTSVLSCEIKADNKYACDKTTERFLGTSTVTTSSQCHGAIHDQQRIPEIKVDGIKTQINNRLTTTVNKSAGESSAKPVEYVLKSSNVSCVTGPSNEHSGVKSAHCLPTVAVDNQIFARAQRSTEGSSNTSNHLSMMAACARFRSISPFEFPPGYSNGSIPSLTFVNTQHRALTAPYLQENKDNAAQNVICRVSEMYQPSMGNMSNLNNLAGSSIPTERDTSPCQGIGTILPGTIDQVIGEPNSAACPITFDKANCKNFLSALSINESTSNSQGNLTLSIKTPNLNTGSTQKKSNDNDSDVIAQPNAQQQQSHRNSNSNGSTNLIKVNSEGDSSAINSNAVAGGYDDSTVSATTGGNNGGGAGCVREASNNDEDASSEEGSSSSSNGHDTGYSSRCSTPQVSTGQGIGYGRTLTHRLLTITVRRRQH